VKASSDGDEERERCFAEYTIKTENREGGVREGVGAGGGKRKKRQGGEGGRGESRKGKRGQRDIRVCYTWNTLITLVASWT